MNKCIKLLSTTLPCSRLHQWFTSDFVLQTHLVSKISKITCRIIWITILSDYRKSLTSSSHRVFRCVFVSSLSFRPPRCHKCISANRFHRNWTSPSKLWSIFRELFFIFSSLFIYLFIFSADAECVERRSCQSPQPGLGGWPNMGKEAGCCGGRMEIEDSCLFLWWSGIYSVTHSLKQLPHFLSDKQHWRRTRTFF